MALTDNLVSFFRCDEASGNLLDSWGANNFTETGSSSAVSGVINGARNLSATNYFLLADNADFSAGDVDFSFAFWIKADSLPGTNVPFRKDNNSTQREYGCYWDGGAGRLKFYVFTTAGGTGFTEVPANTFGSLSTGTYYFVACGHSAASNEIWISINAGTVDTASHTTGVADGTADFNLGTASGGSPWHGPVDLFGFWKRDIRSDLATLYNGGAGLDPTATASTVIPVFMSRWRRMAA